MADKDNEVFVNGQLYPYTAGKSSSNLGFDDGNIPLSFHSQGQSTLRISVPTGDYLVGNWTQADLYSKIDERDYSDVDLIRSDRYPNNSKSTVYLSGTESPNRNDGHVIAFRTNGITGGSGLNESLDLTVSIYQDSGVIAFTGIEDVSRYTSGYFWYLPTGNVSYISDYNDLRLGFNAHFKTGRYTQIGIHSGTVYSDIGTNDRTNNLIQASRWSGDYATEIRMVKISSYRVGNPLGNMHLLIYSDDGGSPPQPNAFLASGEVSVPCMDFPEFGGSFLEYKGTNFTITAGVPYWFVLSGNDNLAHNASNYIKHDFNTAPAAAMTRSVLSNDGGQSWSDLGNITFQHIVYDLQSGT